jgi:nicotinamide mononucleotide transporter
MTGVEIVAALFGAVAVYLAARERIWTWPTAIVNAGLYILIFRHTRLYAQMGLQAIYLALSVYGWYQWRHGGEGRAELHVSRSSFRLLALLAAIDVIAWLLLAALLHRHTNAALPYLDSLLTTTSLIAQWMMTRKILESWILWIAVDLVYVPMFVMQGLYPTAALYAVFLGLALLGLRDWRLSFARTARTGA